MLPTLHSRKGWRPLYVESWIRLCKYASLVSSEDVVAYYTFLYRCKWFYTSVLLYCDAELDTTKTLRNIHVSFCKEYNTEKGDKLTSDYINV